MHLTLNCSVENMKICKCIWVIQLPPSWYVISVAKDNWKMIIGYELFALLGQTSSACVRHCTFSHTQSWAQNEWHSWESFVCFFVLFWFFYIDNFNASANCMHLKRHLNQYTLPQLLWCRFSLDGQFDPLSQPVGKFELALNLIFSRVSLCFV